LSTYRKIFTLSLNKSKARDDKYFLVIEQLS
jgi:hypothetical protein